MFAKLTGEFDAAIDTGIEDEFRFLDWVAAAKLGEEYAGIQSYLTDQGIVYRVMEVRKAAPLGNPNTLVVRPYDIVDAIQVSSLIDRIKLAAEALNLTLTPDYTAVADPPMAP
jgi:hypothetical protein